MASATIKFTIASKVALVVSLAVLRLQYSSPFARSYSHSVLGVVRRPRVGTSPAANSQDVVGCTEAAFARAFPTHIFLVRRYSPVEPEVTSSEADFIREQQLTGDRNILIIA
jgi:hypothetical protein